MAQLTATITVAKQETKNHRYENFCSIAIGDGSNTYGTGIAVTGQAFGLPAGVIDRIVCDVADIGYLARYDAASAKIKIYEVDPDSTNDVALSELDSGDTPAAMVITCVAMGY